MHRGTLEELSYLAEQVNHVSRLVAEGDQFMRPSEGNWAPRIKPFDGNFPRKMPIISNWVIEARKWIEEGRPGVIGECPFDFVLTDYLDRFWALVDGALAIAQPLQSPSFVVPPHSFGLYKDASIRIAHWSYRVEDSNVIEWILDEETVAMIAEDIGGIFIAPPAWNWHPGDGSPRLVPLRSGGLLPRELIESPAGLPIFIDAVRRAIKEFRRKHGYCSNCCGRTPKAELHWGLCSTCAGIIH